MEVENMTKEQIENGMAETFGMGVHAKLQQSKDIAADIGDSFDCWTVRGLAVPFTLVTPKPGVGNPSVTGIAKLVIGAKCIKMKIASEEESGRKSVVPASDETFEIMGDTVIVAIGNDSNETIKEASSSINFDSKGRIITDAETCRTSQPFVYAGGDIVTGAATVILAMGAGKAAANQIAKDIENHKS